MSIFYSLYCRVFNISPYRPFTPHVNSQACYICLENLDETTVAHLNDGEKHPLHLNCLKMSSLYWTICSGGCGRRVEVSEVIQPAKKEGFSERFSKVISKPLLQVLGLMIAGIACLILMIYFPLAADVLNVPLMVNFCALYSLYIIETHNQSI